MSRDETKMFDVRTLERNIRKGLITRKDFDKYLKTLPDRAANAAWTRMEDIRTAADDDDDVRGPDEPVGPGPTGAV